MDINTGNYKLYQLSEISMAGKYQIDYGVYTLSRSTSELPVHYYITETSEASNLTSILVNETLHPDIYLYYGRIGGAINKFKLTQRSSLYDEYIILYQSLSGDTLYLYKVVFKYEVIDNYLVSSEYRSKIIQELTNTTLIPEGDTEWVTNWMIEHASSHGIGVTLIEKVNLKSADDQGNVNILPNEQGLSPELWVASYLHLGDISTLTTDIKTSAVAAINELVDKVIDNSGDISTLLSSVSGLTDIVGDVSQLPLPSGTLVDNIIHVSQLGGSWDE